MARTVRALELLAIKPRSAPELADGLGVHVRTARRVLRRLESEGYVNMSKGRRRRYHPTMHVVALAGQVVDRAELPKTAQPHVTDLREELGLGTHLCVPSYLVRALPRPRGRRRRRLLPAPPARARARPLHGRG